MQSASAFLYMQSDSALYAKCPYYAGTVAQSIVHVHGGECLLHRLSESAVLLGYGKQLADDLGLRHGTGRDQLTLYIHAKNKIAGRFIPSLVLGFWDKNTGIAPAPCHIAGIFRSLPGSRHPKQKKS